MESVTRHINHPHPHHTHHPHDVKTYVRRCRVPLVLLSLLCFSFPHLRVGSPSRFLPSVSGSRPTRRLRPVAVVSPWDVLASDPCRSGGGPPFPRVLYRHVALSWECRLGEGLVPMFFEKREFGVCFVLSRPANVCVSGASGGRLAGRPLGVHFIAYLTLCLKTLV